MSFEKFVQNSRLTAGPDEVVVKLTDLNLARALNRAAMGERDVALAAPLNKKSQQICK